MGLPKITPVASNSRGYSLIPLWIRIVSKGNVEKTPAAMMRLKTLLAPAWVQISTLLDA